MTACTREEGLSALLAMAAIHGGGVRTLRGRHHRDAAGVILADSAPFLGYVLTPPARHWPDDLRFWLWSADCGLFNGRVSELSEFGAAAGIYLGEPVTRPSLP